jgi:molybdopterin molybdotransferase
MTSGRELVMPNQQKKEGQLFNSNFFLLQGILHREGLKDLTFYHVSDDPARFDDELTKVRRLAFDADLIISTGGVSVGLYDTMPKLYEKLGATPLYRRIVMRPGSASYGAVISHDNSHLTTILGLSGNPAAAFNACHLIAIPILRYLRGDTTTKYPVITCRLTCPINKESVVDRYVQGHIDFIDGQPAFTPNKLLKSSAVLELSHTNGLGLIKKGAPPPQTGQDISVSLLHTI